MAEKQFGTGMEAVDYLQVLQRRLDAIREPHIKGETLVRALGQTSFRELMERPVVMTATKVVGSPFVDPDLRTPPEDLIVFERKLVFTGSVEHIGYIDNPRLSLDTLSLIVPDPDLLSIDVRDAGVFEGLEFQIPVGAIGVCRRFAA